MWQNRRLLQHKRNDLSTSNLIDADTNINSNGASGRNSSADGLVPTKQGHVRHPYQKATQASPRASGEIATAYREPEESSAEHRWAKVSVKIVQGTATAQHVLPVQVDHLNARVMPDEPGFNQKILVSQNFVAKMPESGWGENESW